MLLQLCGAPDGYSSVILNGSGTASIESVIVALADVSLVVLSDELAEAFEGRRQAIYYSDLLTQI